MKILMEHPNLGPERQQWVDAEAFTVAWSKNGWVEVERKAEVEGEDIVAPVTSEGVPVPAALPSWELDHEGNPLNADATATPAEESAVESEVKGPAKNRTNPPKN